VRERERESQVKRGRGRLGMAMGWGGDGFCHPCPHPLIPYTYLLPYLYPTGMRN